ncbi:MAG TPA: hypothetical protein VIR01_01625 [Pyrinomonadaceae bacterium]|jgi:hypothetical protein
MSDYLTNLASRSTQQGNLLAPRLPSVFESQTSDVPVQFLESFDESEQTLAGPQAPERRMVKPATRPESSTPQDGDDPAVSMHQDAKTSGEISLAVELPVHDLLNETPTFEERDEVGPSATAPNASLSSPESTDGPNARPAEESPAVHAQSKNLPGRDKNNIARVRPPSSRSSRQIRTQKRFHPGDEPANLSLPAEISREVISNDGINEESSNNVGGAFTKQLPETKRVRRSGEVSVARERELRASLPMDQLLDRSSSAGSAYSNGPAATESPEPVINVTIGRIEVRATQSSASEKRGSHRSPVMPLEDYLKLQRRGGAR